jgi:RNA-directed DNA polymerase
MSTALREAPEDLRKRFLALKTPQGLADLLDVPLQQLMYHARVAPPSVKYTVFSVSKKSGGVRTISAPSSPIKTLQRKLNQVLQAVYERKPSVHGFAAERSVVTNARVHAGARFVLNADLKDFFPTINFGRVRGLFMAKPYNLDAAMATLLAQIACDGSLPQGAPSSPVISNMICAKMDSQMQRLAQRFACRYTRYADDLTYSTSRRRFPAPLARFVETSGGEQLTVGAELEKVIKDNGFAANPDKIRLQTKNKRQQVTGLTVNQFPNVSRRYIGQIRAMLHAWEKFGPDGAELDFHMKWDRKHRNPKLPKPSFARVVRGKLAFLRMVRGKNDRVYIKFLRQFAALAPNFNFTVRVHSHDDLALIGKALWVLETAIDTKDGVTVVQGTAFALAGVGMITCSHTVYPETEAFQPEESDKRYRVTLIANEPTVDLAVVAVPVAPKVELVRGDANSVKVADSVFVYGFPNYSAGDTGLQHAGNVTGFRMRSGIRRILVDAHIISGNSGGPVLDKDNRVIGIAVTGADNERDAPDTENHGVIPIDALASVLAPHPAKPLR